MSNKTVRIQQTVGAEYTDTKNDGPNAYNIIRNLPPGNNREAWESVLDHGVTVFSAEAHGLFQELEDKAEKSQMSPVDYLKTLLKMTDNVTTLMGYVPPPEVLASLGQNKRTVGTAKFRIQDAAEKIMAKKSHAVTGALLFKLCGSNQNSIRAWLKTNAELVSEYHDSIGCTDSLNFNRNKGPFDV